MAAHGASQPVTTRLATVAEIDCWLRDARAGARFVYCTSERLIRGPTSAHVLELERLGQVDLVAERRAGGGYDYLIQRKSGARVKPAARAAQEMDEASDTIFRLLKRAANFGQRCPSDAELAKAAGLATRDQAQWRIRKLVGMGLINSMLVTEDGANSRVVTIMESKRRTALPPKWAALEAARKQAGGAK